MENNTMKKFIILSLLLVPLTAIRFASIHNVPEWQKLDIHENIVSFASTNGINYALSETDKLYNCPSIVESNRCSNHLYPADLSLVKQLVDIGVNDNLFCQSLHKSLQQLIGDETKIISCALSSNSNLEQLANVAFLVDEKSAVWRWIEDRRTTFYLAARGAVMGQLFVIVLFAIMTVFFWFIRTLRLLEKQYF